MLSEQPALEQPVELSIPGIHAVENAVAASACALAAGANLEQIAAGLALVSPIAGRLDIKPLANNSAVIDDSYNASPSSFRAAIDVLANRSGRKILVMGDMGELGDDSVNMHAEVGAYALEVGVDALYAVGELSASACAAFGGNHFQSKELLATAVAQELTRASADNHPITFLVKGSRSAGMEKIVEHLTTRGND